MENNKNISDWKLFNMTLKNAINTQIINVLENGFKFSQITKVQNSVIPYFIKNKDVIVKVSSKSYL